MRSSELSDSHNSSEAKNVPGTTEKKTQPSFRVSLISWLLRLVLGGVFVFSGFSKAVDPWGGLYKISDYFVAWGIECSHEFALITACLLAGFEFALGIMVLLGCYRRVLRFLIVVFMAFMTILTLYIWIVDPVSDCGCFGEALVISNAATFWKNVILLVLALLFYRYNVKVQGLIRPKIQWLALVVTCIYILSVQIYGYQIQPLIDFLPYKVDTSLSELISPAHEDIVKFIYEKDGLEEIFDVDNLPDESWTFVRRIEDNVSRKEGALSIFDGDEDIADDVIETEGDQYILVISDPRRYGMARAEMANRLYEYAVENGNDMICIMATPTDSVECWRNKTDALYPIYTAEDTDLKMMVRGDAGLIMLRDGKILWKTNVYALSPDFPDKNENPLVMVEDRHQSPLAQMTIVWIISLVLLYIVSRFSFVFKKKKDLSVH